MCMSPDIKNGMMTNKIVVRFWNQSYANGKKLLLQCVLPPISPYSYTINQSWFQLVLCWCAKDIRTLNICLEKISYTSKERWVRPFLSSCTQVVGSKYANTPECYYSMRPL